MVIGVGKLCLTVVIIGFAKIVASSTVAPQTNDTGVCEAKICSKLEYYDKLKQKCRDFPGGGFLVIMDHSTKCAHGDSGLHTFSRRDFYYVCHPDGVMIGLCPENTVFSDTEKRCLGQTSTNQPTTIKVHDESRNCNIIVPDCSGVGLFPIPSNCSFYFKCQEHNYNFHQYVYQCPAGTFFHPDLQKCSSSNKCYEAQEEILHNFSKDYFPECRIHGQFRTAKDCTLYYRCVPTIDGSFYQIRYECPYNMYYNIEKEMCLPEQVQCCDYIPHERIIENYKQQHSIDCSTLDPLPTTVISAINTNITSSVPMYYATTQSLYVDDPESLVQETSASYSTTTAFYEDEMEMSAETPDYINPNKSNENEPSEMPYTMRTTADNDYSTPTYGDEGQSSPYQILMGDDTYPPSTTPGTYESNTATDPYKTTPEPTRPKSRPGYDEMEWDDSAWDIPGRKRTTTTAPSTDYPDTSDIPVAARSNDDAYELPDHYPPSDSQYAISTIEPYEGLGCELLSCSTAARLDEGTPNCSETPVESITEDYQTESNITTESDGALEINCTADKDGEIVCNGQKLSINGYLEMLGYAFQFSKWQDLPDEPTIATKPTLKFHFTIEYPFNYEFKARALDYRTSFSYEHSPTVSTEPNLEVTEPTSYE